MLNLFKKGNVYFSRCSDGVLVPYLDLTKSTRTVKWITLEQISIEYPEAIDRIAYIIFSDGYDLRQKNYCRSLLLYLESDQFLSWKQFDSIFTIYKHSREYYDTLRGSYSNNYCGSIVTIRGNGQSMTYRGNKSVVSSDREFDILHKKIFGFRPVYSEEIEDGMSMHYRDDGSRYFAWPTESELKFESLELF